MVNYLHLEIDCAPGPIRPDVYAQVICSKHNIEYKEPVTKFFGNWVWDLPTSFPEELLTATADTVMVYLKELYERNNIRYGAVQCMTGEKYDEIKKEQEKLLERLKNGEKIEFNK